MCFDVNVQAGSELRNPFLFSPRNAMKTFGNQHPCFIKSDQALKEIYKVIRGCLETFNHSSIVLSVNI